MKQFLGPVVLLCTACVPGLTTPAPKPQPPVPQVTGSNIVTQITSEAGVETWPRLSPDAKMLLYHSVDTSSTLPSRFRLVTTSPTNGAMKQFVGNPGSMFGTWNPSGSQIVYTYNAEGRWRLVRSPATGFGVTFVAVNPLGTAEAEPDVSPDGRLIAFHTNLQGRITVCTIGMDGSGFTSYVEGGAPRWHPSGNKLVYVRTLSGKDQVFTLDIKTGQVTQLTSGTVHNTYPYWSPDGAWIVFQSDRSGQWQLFVMRADGSQLTQLTQGDKHSMYPSWGRDGSIYYVWHLDDKQGDIYKLTPRLPK